MKKITHNFVMLSMIAAWLFCGLSFTACTSDIADNPVVVPDPQPQPIAEGFFTPEINRLIDENYPDLVANGYAKLVIPKSMYRQGLFVFPATATSDMEAMVAAGYKVYVNGGTVRDGVMGKEAHDVDFTTDADIMNIKDVLPHAEAFNAFRNIWVAKAYHGDELETDIAPMFSIFPELSGKADIPVASNPGSPYCTDLLEDTYSRDYTINAMYYDYATGDIIDYHGGLHDLRDGILRTVFNADLSVSTDARKYFRAPRFAAKYNLTIDPELDKAFKNHTDVMKDIDENNAVYQTVSGFDGGFVLAFYKLLEQYQVTDFFYSSMKDYQHTEAYDGFVEGILGAFDKTGKVDMALCYAAIFWPRFVAEIAGKDNPTADDMDAAWKAIDEANAPALRFEKESYGDYSYAPTFIKDVWLLQLLMTTDDNMTDAKAADIKSKDHYAEALQFLKARATLDSSLQKYADYWK